jgi:2-phospho-L-lactate guanylyltransferase
MPIVDNGLFAVIPAKAPLLGKSRLSSLLDPPARIALNIALARRTIAVCAETFGAGCTLVVTGSADIAKIARAEGVCISDEPNAQAASHESLNEAVRQGVALAQRQGARGVVVVPTDLPLLSADALSRALAFLPVVPGCLVVGDRRNSGTNLLAMRPADPRLAAFGEDSLGRHAGRAHALGYETRVHRCEQLGLDLDFPEDFHHLETQRSWLSLRSTTSKLSAVPLDSIPT